MYHAASTGISIISFVHSVKHYPIDPSRICSRIHFVWQHGVRTSLSAFLCTLAGLRLSVRVFLVFCKASPPFRAQLWRELLSPTKCPVVFVASIATPLATSGGQVGSWFESYDSAASALHARGHLANLHFAQGLGETASQLAVTCSIVL